MEEPIVSMLIRIPQFNLSYAENGVPKKDGEANFNKDTGTPYAILEDGMVVVLIDNEWIEFKTK